MKQFYYIFTLILAILGVSCGSSAGRAEMDFDVDIYIPEYAAGFDIRGTEDATASLVTVRNPWQGARDVEQQLLILRGDYEVPTGFDGAVVKAPVERVVCMSSSHVAMLDAVGAAECICGVSGIDFLMNDYIRNNRDKVYDIGYDTNLDFERLAALQPDLVLMYGISGDNTQLSKKLCELEIPYIYVGDYVEQSPLGKAEWLMLAAELTDRRDVGIATFRDIADRYNALKAEVGNSSQRPRVMFNTPYRDTWFMPSTRSYMVQLVEDAGGEYIYPENDGDKSLPVDTESAYLLAMRADVWLNVGACNTLHELTAQNPKFAAVPAVTARRVWNCNRRQTAGGGSDFWESGIVRPDRALSDLVAIMRNTDADTTYYYKRLE